MKIAPGNRLSRFGRPAVAILVTVLLSCASNGEKSFIGGWTEIDGEKKIEISKDNVFDGFDYWVVFVDGDTTLQGPGKLAGKDKIQLNFVSISGPGAMGTLVESIRGEVSLVGDELILTMPDSGISRFRREK